MPILAFSHFQLDTERQVLLADGRPMGMRGRPVQILGVLVSKAGETVTADEIVHAVWRGVVVGENNLAVQMSILRRGLRAHGVDDLIVTLPHESGYRFVGTVRRLGAPELQAPAARPATKARAPWPWLGVCAGALGMLGASVWQWPAPRAFVAHVRAEVRQMVLGDRAGAVRVK